MSIYKKNFFRCETCKPQCHEYQYETTQASTVWPSPSYWVTLAVKYGLSYKGITANAELAQKLQTLDEEEVKVGEDQEDLAVLVSKLKQHIRDNFLMVGRIYVLQCRFA